MGGKHFGNAGKKRDKSTSQRFRSGMGETHDDEEKSKYDEIGGNDFLLQLEHPRPTQFTKESTEKGEKTQRRAANHNGAIGIIQMGLEHSEARQILPQRSQRSQREIIDTKTHIA